MVQKHRTTAVRKDQIVTAAKRLIIKRGSENVTVRAIAKEVGLSEGALYRHFKSKRDILSLLADTIEEDLLGDITASSTVSDSYLEILDCILKGHLSAIKQRQGISFQVIAEIISLGDKKLNRRIYEIIGK
ncbi:MAG: helix-turn-helix domain containing protein, partial [Dehalococcoidales bacterium]|nr:helix-turn-helix domain containing protein [Dehalococcoidales bacterium]